jgi:hypothetical protein
MVMLKKWGIIIIALVIVGLAGCASTVPIKSVRLPTIDTSGMQRLAIRDFENRSGVGGSIGAQITQYLTDKAKQLIPATGYFTIVAAADPNAEGVFIGEVRSIVVRDSQEARERKDKDDNPYIEITYNRDVALEFQYSVISTRTGMPVGSIYKRGSQSVSSTESPYSLSDPVMLARTIVDSQMRSLQQDIVPTIVSTNRKLMTETSKDKVVKRRMKEAQSLVRNGNYEEAMRQYNAINSEYGSVAARVNADILMEAITSDAAARARMAELYNNTDGLVEKAAKSAIDALNLKLPLGANIMMVKTRSADRGRLDFAVDQMIKLVIQGGRLRLVDRSNQDLIDAEHQYQLSGNVSDDSIVSIGKQLGVQYIVLCWISGEMSTRRLNIRALNVETAQITEQSDFEI